MVKDYSNKYIFIYTSIMVVVVALILSLLATMLQPLQERNIRLEKMQDILASINIEVEREKSEVVFWDYIIDTKILNHEGYELEGDAFEVDLQDEIRKDVHERQLPLYIAEVEDETYYILPLRGSGLWGAIWGYVSLKSDFNTIAGTNFDHASETPGLGSQIAEKEFENQFKGKKIYDQEGNFRSVEVTRRDVDPDDPHKVDAISGGTMTSNAVSKMLYDGIRLYEPYFKKQKTYE